MMLEISAQIMAGSGRKTNIKRNEFAPRYLHMEHGMLLVCCQRIRGKNEGQIANTAIVSTRVERYLYPRIAMRIPTRVC